MSEALTVVYMYSEACNVHVGVLGGPFHNPMGNGILARAGVVWDPVGYNDVENSGCQIAPLMAEPSSMSVCLSSSLCRACNCRPY